MKISFRPCAFCAASARMRPLLVDMICYVSATFCSTEQITEAIITLKVGTTNDFLVCFIVTHPSTEIHEAYQMELTGQKNFFAESHAAPWRRLLDQIEIVVASSDVSKDETK